MRQISDAIAHNSFIKRELYWLGYIEVQRLFVVSGSPWENGHVEPFNDKLKDELLNRELFLPIDD